MTDESLKPRSWIVGYSEVEPCESESRESQLTVCSSYGQMESAETLVIVWRRHRSYSALDVDSTLRGQCRRTDSVVKLYDVRRESELEARSCTSELILSHT